MEELEQARLLGGRHFDRVRRPATLQENERLQHEDREKGCAPADEIVPQRIRAARDRLADHPIGRPDEPAGKRHV